MQYVHYTASKKQLQLKEREYWASQGMIEVPTENDTRDDSTAEAHGSTKQCDAGAGEVTKKKSAKQVG